MNRNIEDTIKKITLSIIQFDSDIKTGNPEGITNFLSIINTYKDYFSLRVPDKHEEKILFSNFKKEIQDVFTDLFVNDKIFEVAESLFIKNGVIKIPGQIPMEDISPLTEICKISMELSFQVCKYDGSTRDDIKNIRWEKNPLYKLSDEEFKEILIKKESGIRYFKKFDTNPFKEFVSKYQDLYKNNEAEKKYADKYYAWYHKILIAKGKAERFTPGAKQEIADYGKNEYGTKSGFYQAFMDFDLNSRQSFVNSFSQKERKKWKQIIIDISNNDIDVINYLKEFPN